MRTRSGGCYQCPVTACRKRRKVSDSGGGRKRCEIGEEVELPSSSHCWFEVLHDDLVLTILTKLTSSAASPSDFLSILLTCKRFNQLGLHPLVLSKASAKCIAVRARNWSESAHRFIKLCADAGNAEACYTLGMIRFYCLENRGSGASFMARAAIASHRAALYSLAVIQFNGSGGSKADKDIRAGAALCARAAFLGHIDSIREYGHCLQDGYGVQQNVSIGRRYLLLANAREVVGSIKSGQCTVTSAGARGCKLLSDFGCDVPSPEPHPANRFLTEWFAEKGGLAGAEVRLCSHGWCGRPETRPNEFRRCSVCGAANYCSRACQAVDWKVRHKAECTPLEHVVDEAAGEDDVEDDWMDVDVDDVKVDDVGSPRQR